MKVHWSELVSVQLDEAMTNIAQDRPAAAARWLELLLEDGEPQLESEFVDVRRVHVDCATTRPRLGLVRRACGRMVSLFVSKEVF